jgi:hypothetical protein
MVWFLLACGSKFAAITEEDFDDAYDELVTEGELVDDVTTVSATPREPELLGQTYDVDAGQEVVVHMSK